MAEGATGLKVVDISKLTSLVAVNILHTSGSAKYLSIPDGTKLMPTISISVLKSGTFGANNKLPVNIFDLNPWDYGFLDIN